MMVDHTNLASGNGVQLLPVIRDYYYAARSRAKDSFLFLSGRLQQPAPSFPHKPYSLAIALILGFLQVTSQGKGSTAEPIFDSNPALYYTAVTAFLTYCLAGGFEIVSSSHPVHPIPAAASNLLQRFMFLAGPLSFTATASFLFPESIRAVIFASIFTFISTVYLLYCVYGFKAVNIHGNAIV